MKQTVEEAAMQELNSSYAIIVDGELAYQRQAMINMFVKGAEWFKSFFPMMYFPPCDMPEDYMENTVSDGEETIIATTNDYIIYYKHKGFDVAYREYWKGCNNNKWRWKVRYGRYVNDDEILCWMRK